MPEAEEYKENITTVKCAECGTVYKTHVIRACAKTYNLL